VFSLWPMTMRVYEQLHAIAEAWAQAEPAAPVQALQQWLQPIVARLRSATHLATEAWRADRDFVYGDMYAQSERALSGTLPTQPLAALLSPRALAADAAPVRQLMSAMEHRFGRGTDAAGRGFRADWAACLLQYFTQAQAVVRVACEVQRHTNRLLGRDAPSQRFSVADIDIYVQLVGMTQGRVPFLLGELDSVLGIHVDIDADAMDIEEFVRHGVDGMACDRHVFDER